ncbi:uncharacterized protein LOC109860425, partial [Pseudomyrmex gracilis]|uniref:uncharacterized protein LOC109860425 n=1 Tax=Pseudomyrmex gracilis TaxID=219809 RepID=UPI000994A4A6
MILLTHQFSGRLFIDMMSFNGLMFIYLLKYHTIYINSTNVKALFEQIKCDCIMITDSREMEIIQKYASRGRYYTVVSGLMMYIGAFFFMTSFFVPDILNIVMPLDEPRLRTLFTPMEWFFDQQKYFYVIVSDIFLIAMAGLTTLLATETMFMVMVQHTCGLLAIA